MISRTSTTMFVGTFLLMVGSPCVAQAAAADVRITEFKSERQGDILQGNGGRRQREFFELANLGATTVDVSTWSFNDNNPNDPHNFGHPLVPSSPV